MITPKEAIAQTSKVVDVAKAILEDAIDKQLSKTSHASVDVNALLSGHNKIVYEKAVHEIIMGYKKLGWGVKRNNGDSQRDGAWDTITVYLNQTGEC